MGRISQIPRKSQTRGFALIITVSLLALLVMVLIAMATLTRVETGVSRNTRLSGQAEQNALFALNIALGELQRHAGPDARITATAEIGGVTSANKHWTGVWAASDGSGLTWLVSGNENGSVSFVPAIAPTDLSVTSTALSDVKLGEIPARVLVGPNTAGNSDVADFVVAPVVDLRGPVAGEASDQIVGRYAWWVGDEGVKAKANLRDPYAEGTATAEEEAYRRTVAQRVGVEHMVSGYPINHSDLDLVIDRNQLPFVGGFDPSAIRDHFHDLSTYSLGVLADVTRGALRTDLNRVLFDTPVGYADNDLLADGMGEIDGDPRWGSLRAFYSQRFGAAPDIAPFASTGMIQGIHPLVTAVSIWTGVTLDGVGTSLHITCRATVTIANPYDVPIGQAPYSVSLASGSNVSVSIGKNNGVTTQPIPGVPEPILLTSLSPSGSLIFATPPTSFAPGEVKIFSTAYEGTDLVSAPSPIPLAEGNPLGESGTFEYYSVREVLPEAPATEVMTAPERAAVRLNTGNVNLQFAIVGGALLQTIENVQVTGDTAYRLIPHSALDFGMTTQYPHVATGSGFTAYMRGASGIAATQNTGRRTTNNVRWLASHSPRAPVLRRPIGDPWAENPLWDGVRILQAGSPVISRDLAEPLWGRSFEPGVGSSSVALFHVLRSEPISLGEFQHASFSTDASVGFRMASYPIGNSYASPYVRVNQKDLSFGINEVLFDGFLLSGFVGSTFPTSPLPNRRLLTFHEEEAPPLTHRNVAAFLLCDGAFNVNSTSAEAWAALLGSLNGIDDPNSAGTPLDHPFFRTPYPTDNASNSSGGVMSLSGAEVSALATSVVSEVRARGPFLSVASFVNRRRPSGNTGTDQAAPQNVRGALQAAIDSTSGLQPGWTSIALGSVPNVASLPYRQAGVGATGANLPGWLSQSDILTALGPVLAVRSDTFLVRTCGESMNPVSGEVEARAWCEAIVQRIPRYLLHDPNEDANGDNGDAPWETPLNHVNQMFGRRFVITSFRWLSPDDI